MGMNILLVLFIGIITSVLASVFLIIPLVLLRGPASVMLTVLVPIMITLRLVPIKCVITSVAYLATIPITHALVVGATLPVMPTISRAVMRAAITQMGGWRSGSEQFHQITSGGSGVNLGTAAAYCGYNLCITWISTLSKGFFYSSGLDQFRYFHVSTSYASSSLLCNSFTPALPTASTPLVGTACSTLSSARSCPRHWGTVGDSGRFATWTSQGYFTISESNLLRSKPPKYCLAGTCSIVLGRNNSIRLWDRGAYTTTSSTDVGILGSASGYCSRPFCYYYLGSDGYFSIYAALQSYGLGVYRSGRDNISSVTASFSRTVCSSFRTIRNGTSFRAPCFPTGSLADTSCPESWGTCNGSSVRPFTTTHTTITTITGFTGSEITPSRSCL